MKTLFFIAMLAFVGCTIAADYIGAKDIAAHAATLAAIYTVGYAILRRLDQ